MDKPLGFLCSSFAPILYNPFALPSLWILLHFLISAPWHVCHTVIHQRKQRKSNAVIDFFTVPANLFYFGLHWLTSDCFRFRKGKRKNMFFSFVPLSLHVIHPTLSLRVVLALTSRSSRAFLAFFSYFPMFTLWTTKKWNLPCRLTKRIEWWLY